MIDKTNPSPDDILRAIQRDDARRKTGQLTIFFGMSAGVGKTYAMLVNAQQLLKAGVDVVIGTVNTHGRAETEILLAGLKIIPKKWIKYKDAVFEEFDLDTVLKLKPKVVLIDELAHTNVPGSKHLKRWQDVEELLDAGIDVYTTLNVQHVESRKDIIEKITSIIIRETVPDLIFERASTITLIDIPPSMLLQRLREGKVYLQNQSQLAIENFFKVDNLTALREIALRFTAEKVDHDLHGMSISGKSWRTRERLMVMINHESISEQLIRSTRRLAFELDAPWIAIYVNSGTTLNSGEQTKLNRYLQLAQELGADVITTDDLDVANALQRIAKEKEVTRLLIARQESPILFKNPFKPTLVDRLQKGTKQFDIIILRQDPISTIYKGIFSKPKLMSSWGPYALSAAAILLVTVVGLFAAPYVGYKTIGIAFLLTTLALAAFVGMGPLLLSASLSAIAWKYLFIHFFYKDGSQRSTALIIIYFLTVLLVGWLSNYVGKREKFYKKHEEKMLLLYEVMREITKSTTFPLLRQYVVKKLKTLFDGDFTILKKNVHNQLVFDDSDMMLLTNEKEQAAAQWAFTNRKIAGSMTDTLPSAEAMFFPIQFSNEPVGLLVYAPKKRSSLSPEEVHLLQSVAEQLGIYLERFSSEQSLQTEQFTTQLEKIQRAIVKSVTNELGDPIEKIIENANLLNTLLHPSNQAIVGKINMNSKRIKMSIDNLMTITQIESGAVRVDKQSHSIEELMEKTVEEVKDLIHDHPIRSDIPKQPLYLNFDLNLIKMALINLLLNVLEYSSFENIHFEVNVKGAVIRFSVVDDGPPIPHDELSLIFEKFYRPLPPSEGIGTGLNIVRAVANIHDGYVEVKENENKGIVFSIVLRMPAEG